MYKSAASISPRICSAVRIRSAFLAAVAFLTPQAVVVWEEREIRVGLARGLSREPLRVELAMSEPPVRFGPGLR